MTSRVKIKVGVKNAGSAKHRLKVAAASTEQAIMQTAEELFARFGYDAVSTKQLAANAGVTIGALYHYFSSKEQLYERVTNNIFDRKSLKPDELFEASDSVENKMIKLLSKFIGNIIADTNYGLLLQRELLNPNTDIAERFINKHFKQSYEVFRQLLAEMLPDANQDLAFASLLALCVGFANLKGIYAVVPNIHEFLSNSDEIAKHITHLMVKGSV